MKNEDLDFFHEAFVYLYRCWLQLNFNRIPLLCSLGENESLLECDDFVLYYTHTNIDLNKLEKIKPYFKKQLYFIAPEICENGTVCGLSLRKERYHNPDALFTKLINFIDSKEAKIKELVELGRERFRIWETKDFGIFKLWEGSSKRLILYSRKNDGRFGYTFTSKECNDIFVRKSKSCKEEGQVSYEGFYKLSTSTTNERISINIDLISNKKEVALLKLQPAGVGYKVFERTSPEIKEIKF